MAESYLYDVFGKADNYGSVGNPYFFTGRRYDPETGLYYYRARMYSSALGRFLQVDPIGYKGGINLYRYVENNPVNYIDPKGTILTRPDFPPPLPTPPAPTPHPYPIPVPTPPPGPYPVPVPMPTPAPPLPSWGSCYRACLNFWKWHEWCDPFTDPVSGVGYLPIKLPGRIGKLCGRFAAIGTGWCAGLSYGCMAACYDDPYSYPL